MATPLDAEVTALARHLAELGRDRAGRVFRMSWWGDRLLQRAMANPAFKTELFRFVDVFPATTGDDDVLRHLDEYFSGRGVPTLLALGVDVAEAVPGIGAHVSAGVAERNIRRMAEQFIVGTDAAEAVPNLRGLWEHGAAFTVDLLGEKTVVGAEADRYAARVQETLTTLLDATASWPPRPVLEADDAGSLPRVNVSVKATALASKLSPLTSEAGLEQAKARLRPLLRLAAARGAFVNLDMEHAEVKDLTLRLFRELLDEPELAGLQAGIAVQAYLKDSGADLAELVSWSGRRSVPITVRLVKGAYWDTETVVAGAAGWPSPVFEDKAATDANFERCVRLLHDHHGSVKAAFGSHNLRSLAYAVTYARSLGIDDRGYELQMLAGMAEPIQAAVCRLGMRLRVYAPIGELVPGMAYLVRRLLENTSNESFVRQRFAEGRRLDDLLAPPAVDRLPGPPPPARRALTDPTAVGTYEPEPIAEWRRQPVRAAFARAVAEAGAGPALEVPAVVGGRRLRTPEVIESLDPARHAVVVATSAACGTEEADAAVEVAAGAVDRWRRTPTVERAAVLFRAAEWMRARRPQLGALEVLEAGKPWAEADADVCEAIDFCEYYGREMLRLDRGGAVSSPPGESNRLRYQGKGVAVVIAPWNFPLAIPCGMTVAALVAGNTVVLKPAEQTPAVAFRLVEALEAAGLPPGVLNFLPGPGEEVGAPLVRHPDVALVAFTGSREVGLEINRVASEHRPGQRSVKRVVAEMGGKNALVVDADADLDQAVPAVVASAFGYSGQKCSACSRLVLVDAVHDAFLERLLGAVGELTVGRPAEMGTELGPVIDAEAQRKVRAYAELAGEEGEILLARSDVPADGFYVGPVVVGGLDPSTSRVAREEIFGPVLSVLRARDFDAALALANDTDYGLTAGIYSRSPAHIRRAATELRAGNVYVNRALTGAVVGRQPFGGYGLSGVGSKAGGPDYLLQFLDPRVVTENTMRQGFAPLD
ncbi:MAG: proline dehydrogenase family protein [Actinobacteria bacterium]|nr:proline dehydrogenase family protein [Actinomycetota bacterium]